MSVSPGQDRIIRRHPKPTPVPKPPPPAPPAPAATTPTPPTGWVKTYSHDFAHTAPSSTAHWAGLADWVVQPGDNAPIAVHTAVGSEFGLGIQITAESEWSELISSDAVVGPSSFVQALLYIPLAPNGDVANWPAFWTTGPSWPEDGEIDILEGQSGRAALQTHYGTLTSSGGASENSASLYAPVGTGDWLTVTLLRESGEATAWYGALKVGTVAAPFTEDHVLIFQNQSYSTYTCPNCFGPYEAGTAYLSNVEIYAPKS